MFLWVTNFEHKTDTHKKADIPMFKFCKYHDHTGTNKNTVRMSEWMDLFLFIENSPILCLISFYFNSYLTSQSQLC